MEVDQDTIDQAMIPASEHVVHRMTAHLDLTPVDDDYYDNWYSIQWMIF